MVISGILSEAVTVALVGVADNIGVIGFTCRITPLVVTIPPEFCGISARTLKK